MNRETLKKAVDLAGQIDHFQDQLYRTHFITSPEDNLNLCRIGNGGEKPVIIPDSLLPEIGNIVTTYYREKLTELQKQFEEL